MTDGRLAALERLVSFVVPIADAQAGLKKYSWDSDVLIVLRAQDLARIPDRFQRGELSEGDVAAWAEAIEMREDIGIERDELNDLLFELANPEISMPLTRSRAADMISQIRVLLSRPAKGG